MSSLLMPQHTPPAEHSVRRRLLSELAAGSPVRLELVVLQDADGLDPFLTEPSDCVMSALEGNGARVFRLGSAFAAVAAPSAPPARTLLADAIHGEATLPDDGTTPERILAVAEARLRARARTRRGSAARQVRDVLMQLLAERGAGGRGAATSRVAGQAVTVGRRLGMEFSELDVVARAAELQDLGRLLIPDRILDKKDPLTTEDWALVRRHPLVGERILAAAPALAPVARLVRSCGEHYDGSGYPDGLVGERIPLGARVISVCVAFDAMTSTRPYRPALAATEAVAELCNFAGRWFDPRVVAAFCGMLFDLR